MSRKGAICFIAALISYLFAWLIGPRDYWRITVLKILEPAGLILFVFATYYSGLALLSEYRAGKKFFSGGKRTAHIALVAVALLSLAATITILIFTKFPLGV